MTEYIAPNKPKQGIMPQKMLATITDIDGTLSDHEWREKFIPDRSKVFPSSAYDDYNSRLVDDEPFDMVCRLHRSYYQQGFYSVLLTARSDKYKKETIRWLKAYNIPCHRLYMRPNGNMQSDSDYKRSVAVALQAENFVLQLAIDDRKSTIDMWQELEIPSLQFRKGNKNE